MSHSTPVFSQDELLSLILDQLQLNHIAITNPSAEATITAIAQLNNNTNALAGTLNGIQSKVAAMLESIEKPIENKSPAMNLMAGLYSHSFFILDDRSDHVTVNYS